MSRKITPLTLTTTPHMLTTSKLEASDEIGDQEFDDNYEQGKFHPVSKDSSGKGDVSMEPTYYDRRNGVLCSFLAEETK